MASIKKLSDGKYLIRVSHGTGGRRQRVNKIFYGSRRDAEQDARDEETMLHSGRGHAAGLRFEKYLPLWIKSITPRLSPRTVSGYDEYIRRYALASLTGLKLGEIETYHIQQIYNATDKSPTTVRNLHASLNACFSWAVKHDYIKSNPCRNTERPAKVRPDIITLDPAEAARFADICREMRLGIVFEFALETGMRPEEYLALRWRDVAGREISVCQAVQFNAKGGGYYFKDIKTQKGRRRISISETLRLRLVQHRREQNEQRLAMKGTWFNHDLVFPNEIGRPYHLTNLIRRYLRPVLRAMWPPVELPDGSEQPHPDSKHITLYSLRHTCATLLLMSGYNAKIVADRLGHSSVVMTLDTYGHVQPHIQDEATDAMERILRGKRA